MTTRVLGKRRTRRGEASVSAPSLLLLALALAACGNTAPPDDGPDGDGSGDEGARDDLVPSGTAVSGQTGTWCELPSVASGEAVPLDKTMFVETFADYSAGWMTPLADALLQIDEGAFFDAMFESVMATYEKQCSTGDTFAFAPTDELDSAENQADVRQAVVDFFADAVELESGTRLRLEFHECTSCGEPLGEAPSYLNAELTTDGLLSITVEFESGVPWTRSVFLTPTTIAVQAELEPVSNWGARASAKLRSGEVSSPRGKGRATVLAARDGGGHVSVSAGFEGLEFVQNQAERDEVAAKSSTSCIGFGVALGPEAEGSKVTLLPGNTTIVAQGGVHCGTTGCGERERNGYFEYEIGDSAFVIEAPPAASGRDLGLGIESLGLWMARTSDEAADLGWREFANAGFGRGADGGPTNIAVAGDEEAFSVTFEPPLGLSGAMAISAFSDQMRAQLPSWLADELFDLTFGGEPVGSIRIPRREICPEGVYPYPEVARRMVEITAGGGQLESGGTVRQAAAGQCIAESQADPATFDHVSDWWDVGIACQ